MAKPFIVAEMSCNHLGSIERAVKIVEEAATAGADAVKAQIWDEMVLDESYVIEEGPWAGRKLVDLYDEAKTPWEWYPALKATAKLCGVELFASVFDTASLKFLEEQRCPRYKIASFEITDLPLIKEVAATKKPVIISTGMATQADIFNAVAAYRNGNDDLTQWPALLKCTSAYPSPANEINLESMLTMGSEFGLSCEYGLSDHSTGTAVSVAATALGASIIEKHFTLSRADGGLDAGFSMEPREFYKLVRDCRMAAEAMTPGPSLSEQPHLKLRRSLYYSKSLKAGDIVSSACVTTARPALGLMPSSLDTIAGRTLLTNVSSGYPVRMTDFEHRV